MQAHSTQHGVLPYQLTANISAFLEPLICQSSVSFLALSEEWDMAWLKIEEELSALPASLSSLEC